MSTPLPADLEKLRADLSGRLSTNRMLVSEFEPYLENEQQVAYIAPALRQELGEQITAVILALPLAIVDAVENRLDIEGFRYPGMPSGDAGLWSVWQANNMDEQAQQGHFDAIGLSRAAVIVGPRDDDSEMPLITVESARDVAWKRDPATMQVTAGL